ncbi:MAG: hypothetical protein ABW277_21570 [Longimicrobiaceae bacterium]
MSRSFIRLRRILFCTSCMVVFGFGATQASPAFYWVPISATCNRYDPSSLEYCAEKCYEAGYTGGGSCSFQGRCQCWVSPMGGSKAQ